MKFQFLSKLGIHLARVVIALLLPTVPAICAAQGDVTDPAAAVPPVVYQSVFADTPQGVEMQTTDWKKANAEVGQFRRGHVDILKWEEANPPAKPPNKAPAQALSKPGMPGGAPATPAGAAAGMHKH